MPQVETKQAPIFYTDNTVAADDLVTQEARASVAMPLTKFSWNIPT